MKTPRNDPIGWGLVGAGLIALILLVPGLTSPGQPAAIRVLLGWGAFIAVPAAILGGILLAFAGRMGWEVRWRAIFFGELLFLAVIGLVHLGLPQPRDAAWAGLGGGVVGQALTQPLIDLLGMLGARLVMVAAVVAAAEALWLSLPPRWTGRVHRELEALGHKAWETVHRGAGELARSGCQGEGDLRFVRSTDPSYRTWAGWLRWARGSRRPGAISGRAAAGARLQRSLNPLARRWSAAPLSRPAIPPGNPRRCLRDRQASQSNQAAQGSGTVPCTPLARQPQRGCAS